MLAYHWSSALELVRASGGGDDELVERTRRALRAAGDRAFALNSYVVAAAQYEDALALLAGRCGERPEVLFQRAVALHRSYDETRQQDALEAARDALLAIGDRERASEAESFLSRVFWDRGEHDPVQEHLERAEELARRLGLRRDGAGSRLLGPHPSDRDRARAGTSPARGKRSRWRPSSGSTSFVRTR